MKYSPASIKLTVCRNCQNNVDPYVERDYLLVVLDCILLRIPAYRHVLYNVDLEMNLKRALQFALASSILQAYQAWEGIRMTPNLREEAFWFLLLGALIGLWLQWVCLSVSAKSPVSSSRLYTALVLPTSFSVITNLVLVWENTETVRVLGRSLETTYQMAAVTAAGGNTIMFVAGLFMKAFITKAISSVTGLPCQIQIQGFCLM